MPWKLSFVWPVRLASRKSQAANSQKPVLFAILLAYFVQMSFVSPFSHRCITLQHIAAPGSIARL